MRLGFCTMPMHPPGRDWSQTLQEDREAVILADRLGWHDAFVGEHLTDRYETITNSLLFLATLIPETSTIRLATGTTNLSHLHPALVAAHGSMFDHLSGGRYVLGISPGALPSDAEVLGILDEDRAKMFEDAVDVILGLWTGEAPYDMDLPGNRFTVSTARTFDRALGLGAIPKPLQRPHPEVVGTVLSPYSSTATMLGRRGFHPLSAHFLRPAWVASHWAKYAEGTQLRGVAADPDDWRVARTVFVADDPATAAAYGRDDEASPYRQYYAQMLRKMTLLGRLIGFKVSAEEPDEAVSLDRVLSRLVISGTPDSVAQQLVEFHDAVGPFGELVYAGLDWVDPALARRSMELMTTEVMPKVEAALGTAQR